MRVGKVLQAKTVKNSLDTYIHMTAFKNLFTPDDNLYFKSAQRISENKETLSQIKVKILSQSWFCKNLPQKKCKINLSSLYDSQKKVLNSVKYCTQFLKQCWQLQKKALRKSACIVIRSTHGQFFLRPPRAGLLEPTIRLLPIALFLHFFSLD